MTHARPKVSVIVPSYNHARYLPQRLDSIFAQTFQDFELIFLDDASPDGSLEVFRRYAGRPRVRAVFNEKNSGSVFKQWNRGFELATGEFIWIAESDDVAHPRLLEALVGLLEGQPDVVLAYGNSMVIDPEGNRSRLISEWANEIAPGRWDRDLVGEGMAEIRRYLVQRNTVPNASAVVFRRSALRQAGPVRTDFRLVGDWAFWVGLLEHGRLAYTAEELNCFRKHPQTATMRSWAESGDLEESYRLVGEIASRFDPETEALEASLRKLAEDWFWRWHSVGRVLPKERHQAIRRAASAADPGLRLRWLKLSAELRWTQVRRRLMPRWSRKA